MNTYIIIRCDTKNISYSMTKKEAFEKLQQYNRDGISAFVISSPKHLDFHISKKLVH